VSSPYRSRIDRWAAPVLVLATALHALPALTLPVATLDEIILLDYPDVVRRGATPHEDFYTVYARLGYDVLGSAYDVVAYSPHVERAVGLGYQVTVVLGVWALCRRLGRRVAIGSGLLAVTLMPNDVTAFAWLGGLGLALWALVLVRSESRRWAWLLGGVLAGLSIGWRYEMAVVVGLSLLPLVHRHRRAPFVLLGGVMGAAPTVWHLFHVGEAAWGNLTGRMGVNFQLEPGSVPPHVHWGMAVGALALAVLVLRALRVRAREDWAWALLGLSVVPQAVQRIDVYHFGFAAVIVCPLAFAGGVDLVRRSDDGRARRLGVAGLVVLLSVPALFAVGSAATAATAPETGTVTSGSRSIRLPADRVTDTQALLDDVREVVPAGSALFLGSDQMGRTSFNAYPLYYLLSEDYEFNSYFLELAAGVAERDGSGLSADIRRADALILARFDSATGDRLFPFAPRGFGEHDRTVREEFELVRTYGRLSLWARRP